jgi:hypothetical protein
MRSNSERAVPVSLRPQELRLARNRIVHAALYFRIWYLALHLGSAPCCRGCAWNWSSALKTSVAACAQHPLPDARDPLGVDFRLVQYWEAAAVHAYQQINGTMV